MRTKVVSFFIFFQDLSNKNKFKKLRPKMTKIASRGPALNSDKARSKLYSFRTLLKRILKLAFFCQSLTLPPPPPKKKTHTHTHKGEMSNTIQDLSTARTL